MGDIIKNFEVRSINSKKLNLYFDAGSSLTFIKHTVAKELGGLLALPRKIKLKGLGEGEFEVTHLMNLEIKLLDVWCMHPVYVVEDWVLDKDYDILVGHDFMQRFEIKLDPLHREIIIDKNALLRAQRIK